MFDAWFRQCRDIKIKKIQSYGRNLRIIGTDRTSGKPVERFVEKGRYRIEPTMSNKHWKIYTMLPGGYR